MPPIFSFLPPQKQGANKYKTIGILGGMGPEATAELYLRLIRIFQQEYGAKYDDDFPEIIIINLPIPDVVEKPTEEKRVEQMLVAAAQKLQTMGADIIAVPCNTVMSFLPSLQRAVSIQILNPVEEAAADVKRLGMATVGIIATEMTLSNQLYQEQMQETRFLIPDKKAQQQTTKIIMNILAGQKRDDDKMLLLDLIKTLKNSGAEKVILGCTELPLLIKDNIDTIDTVGILAKAIVREVISEKAEERENKP